MNVQFQNLRALMKLSNCSRYIFAHSRIKQNVQAQENFLKPYQEIPKVKGLPLVGSLLDYFTLKKGTTQLDLITARVAKYGSLYREQIPLFGEMLFTKNPDDFEKVLKDEERGSFPKRRSNWALRAYAKKHDIPNPLFDMNEDEFYRRKEAIQKAILVPKEVAKLTRMYSEVTKDFMDYLENQKEYGTDNVHYMSKHLYRWAFECSGVTVFRQRLGALGHKEIHDESAKNLFEGLDKMLVRMYHLERGSPHHRLMNTTLWKRFESQISLQYEAARELVERHGEHVVDKNADLTYEERVSSCIDILRASVDTTAEVAMWALFEISKHAEAQNKLYNEITNKIGVAETFDHEVIQKTPYLRACLKEVFRLNPLAPLLSHKTQSDLILSGYEVPRGTLVVMLLGYVNQSELFEDSNTFKPERWMKTSSKQCPMKSKPHPFAVVPFGHGIRGCMGRRLAENELYCLFAILFKKFKLQCNKEKVIHDFKFVKTIGEPLSFRLEER